MSRILGTIAGLAAAAVLPLAATPAQAEFPEKDFTLVVGWSAGGGMDAYARTIEKFSEKYLGRGLIVNYKTGGSGRVAFNSINKGGHDDGHTIMITLFPDYMLAVKTRSAGQKGYILDDFKMLGAHACVPAAWVVRKDGKFGSLQNLVDFAKKNPNKVTVGVDGAKSGNNAFRMLMDKKLGIQTKPIVYNGGGNVFKALLGGEVDVFSSNVNWIRRFPDKATGLMMAGASRYSLTPDVSSLKEMNIDVVDCLARAVSVPKGVPQDRVDYLRAGMAKMGADPEFVEGLKKVGLVGDWWDHKKTRGFLNDYVANNQFVFDAMMAK